MKTKSDKRTEHSILLILSKHPDGLTREELIEEVDKSGLLDMSNREFRKYIRETDSPKRTTFLEKIRTIFGN